MAMNRYCRRAGFGVAAGALAVFVAGAAGAGASDPTFAPTGTLEGWIGAVADFNGDGARDLAVVNVRKVTVLLGDGSGHFRAAPGPAVNVGAHPEALSAGDFNGDGRVDLAVTADSTHYEHPP